MYVHKAQLQPRSGTVRICRVTCRVACTLIDTQNVFLCRTVVIPVKLWQEPGGSATVENMTRSPSYLLPAGATRVENAMLPFKLLADDSEGALSVCEFVLPAWSSGPVLHRHEAVDEGFFVVSGRLEFQLDDARRSAEAGDFAWVPRGTAHTFACAGDDPVHVVAFACPGGIEHLFAEQHAYLTNLSGPPDPAVLDEMGMRHGASTVGPPIIARNAPHTPR